MRDRLSHTLYALEIIFVLICAEDTTKPVTTTTTIISTTGTSELLTTSTTSSTSTSTSTTPGPEAPYCKQTELPNKKLYQDCSASGWQDFPKFKDSSTVANTEILNISSNPISMISIENLESFVNLKELIMFNITEGPINSDVLKNLKKLEILNISFTKINTEYGPIQFPNTIFRLFANKIKRWKNSMSQLNIDVELSHLNLTNLAIASNDLNNFPNLNKTCPIVEIDLSENPLANFTYFDLAPFCTLETLYLADTEFSQTEECCGVKTWLDEYNIAFTLSCETKCNFELDYLARDAYSQCEIRIGRLKPDNFLFYYQVIIVTAVILAACFIVYKFYHSRDSKKESTKMEEPGGEGEGEGEGAGGAGGGEDEEAYGEEEVTQIKEVMERN